MLKSITKAMLLAASLSVSSVAGAAIIAVPGSLAATEGLSANTFPYSVAPSRYQQVYAASEFGGVSGLVEEISYRIDAGGSDFSSVFDVEIRLSHTLAGPTTLSNIFSDNLGPDVTTVLDDSSYLLSGTTAPGSPNPFDVTFDIDDVFLYDGVSNLLVDVTVFSGMAGVKFDAIGGPFASSMGRVRGPLGNPLALSGNAQRNFGLITAFKIDQSSAPPPTVISEPPIYAALSLLFLGLIARRKVS